MCLTPAQLAVASDLPSVIEVRILEGNADAAALIQEAVDRAASSHASVKLPPGHYLLARSVVITGGMGVAGDANGTILAPLGTNASNTVTDNVHSPLSSFIGGITIAGGTPSNLRIARNTVTDTQAEKTQAYGIQVREKTQVTRLVIDRDNHLAGNRLGELSGTGEWPTTAEIPIAR